VACLDTKLVVSVGDTNAVTVGSLKAVVSHRVYGSSHFGGEAEIGSVVAAIGGPTIISSLSAISSSSSSVDVYGQTFGSTAADVRVYAAADHNYISPAGINSFVPETRVTISLSDLHGLGQIIKGATLFAIVCRQGVASDKTPIGTVEDLTIHVVPRQMKLARSPLGNRIEVHGSGFGTDPSQVEVVTTVPITGIFWCQDTLIIADTGDTSSLTSTMTASVRRNTEFGVLQSPTVVIAVMETSLTQTPVLASSLQQASVDDACFSLRGQHFGTSPQDVQTYITPSVGTTVFAHAHNMTSTTLQTACDVSTGIFASGPVSAVVSVKGVLSNTATVELKGLPTTVELQRQEQLAPMEGNTVVPVSGTNFPSQRTVLCLWEELGNTTGIVAGDSSSVSCISPRGPPDSVVSLKVLAVPEQAMESGIMLRFFPTMLVSDMATNSILRFNAYTGALWDTFVSSGAGGLSRPWGTAFGPDGNFFVASADTDQILTFHGSTGQFVRKFCDVINPRGIVFHYEDLFVCSPHSGKVLRFNGLTGAPRGILADSPILQHAWSIVFDHWTNHSLVAGHHTHNLVRVDPPGALLGHKSSTSGSNVWTETPVYYATGIEIVSHYVYAVSPYSGKGILQFNRSSGVLIQHYSDDFAVQQAFDIKAQRNSVFVCGAGGIHRYVQHDRNVSTLLEHTVEPFVKHENLKCSFLFIHDEHNQLFGKV